MSHRHLLREIAKVAVGLFLADLVSVLWLGAAGFFPLTILGIEWTNAAVWPIAVFDLAVAALLAHFAWNTRGPATPTEKGLLTFVGFVFLVVCLVHAFRLVFGLDLILGDFMVPLWLSWFGVFVTAYLSYASFHVAYRSR